MCWMFGLNDLDVFDVLYVLDDLDLSRSNQTMYDFHSSRDVRLVLHAGNRRFYISRGQTKLCMVLIPREM